MNNTLFTHSIAFDQNHIVWGTGVTAEDCRSDARTWAGEDAKFCGPRDCLPDGYLQMYWSTEAAYEYAKALGADADLDRFEFENNTVSLKN